MFKGYCFPKEIVLQAVYFKFRFSHSYRDVEELLSIRGVSVDHATIQRWVYKFTLLIGSFIKKRVINSTPINIVILIGKTGIIDSDIKHQLKEAISFYTFQFIRISLRSPSEIITAMQEHEKPADILILSRGGGDNLEIFENPAIAEVSLSLRCIFLTAIGHKENIPLLQKVADKAFITPTALGQYLNDIYNETVEQLQNSKAKLIDDISSQFKANYDKQIQTLNENSKQQRSSMKGLKIIFLQIIRKK